MWTPLLLILTSIDLCNTRRLSLVTEVEQTNALREAEIKCNTQRITYQEFKNSLSESNENDTKMCPQTFDKILCWPETPAGTAAFLPCPSYINLFDIDAFAYRNCSHNGTWRVSTKKNGPSANYMDCIKEGYKMNTTSVNQASSVPELLKKHLPIMMIINVIGYSLSIIALTLAVITMCILRNLLKIPRNLVHFNLFISFLLRGVLTLAHTFLVSLEAEETDRLSPNKSNETSWRCKLLTSVWMYTRLANCMWIFLEAFYLHLLIFVIPFSKRSGAKGLMCAGWGVPLLFTVTWVVVRLVIDDVDCWVAYKNRNIRWIMEGPAVLSVIINFGFFINFVRLLLTKLQSSASQGVKLHISRQLAKSTAILIPLFGVHYIVFLFEEFFPETTQDGVLEVVKFYFDITLMSFQGFTVAILFCFRNEEVITEFKKRVNRFKQKRGWLEGRHIDGDHLPLILPFIVQDQSDPSREDSRNVSDIYDSLFQGKRENVHLPLTPIVCVIIKK